MSFNKDIMISEKKKTVLEFRSCMLIYNFTEMISKIPF